MKLILGVLVVLGALTCWSSDHARADAAEVEALVAKKAAILEAMHRKAAKALLLSAQDESFRNYFLAHSALEKGQIKERIDQISLVVQSRFDVEEMCLINRDGAEITRIVSNRIAHDLALDETGAIFFEPGFALKPRTVYVSPLYVSVDADKWVIGYVTPIEVNGEKPAILHYEHSLEVYQEALNKGLGGDERFLVAVDGGGRVVSDSRRAVPVEKRDDREDPDAYFERFELAGLGADGVLTELGGDCGDGGAVLTAGGGRYAVACRKVEGWTLFAVERL